MCYNNYYYIYFSLRLVNQSLTCNMELKTKEANIGVIVGRFQVPYLHKGHLELIDHVCSKHKKVIVFVGSKPGVLVTRNNPLDFFTRKLMIQQHYPNVVILPIHDMPTDAQWSETLDNKIIETVGDHESVILYGSRDAFIPHYCGKFSTIELLPSSDISGSKIRELVSKEVREQPEFRCGVIYAAHNRHPTIYTTVDIVPVCFNENQKIKGIILGRKKTDPNGFWRFAGGFIDPSKDKSLESAAKREATEEFGFEIGELKYIGSTIIDDWRYQGDVDKIMTSVFYGAYLWGPLQAKDDLNEVQLFDLNVINQLILPQHKPILDLVINFLA